KRVFTFSMHGAKNYPMQKEVSDLDVELEDGASDKIYLNTLKHHVEELLDKVQPDFIFFQSGVDILETDKLGRLGVSMEGCRKRDELVLSQAHANQIPVVASMGGGYSEDINIIVEAHANTYRLAQEIYF
ncbi:MAG: histone deacetylase, partial [Fulvivirga sp.]